MDYLAYPNWLARLLQRWHLRFTRMGRLLQRRGIDGADYARAFPIVELETQFARCHSCERQPLCDRALDTESVPGRKRYSFCPNTPSIESYLRSSRRS